MLLCNKYSIIFLVFLFSRLATVKKRMDFYLIFFSFYKRLYRIIEDDQTDKILFLSNKGNEHNIYIYDSYIDDT
jgi:hypothetical protein